MTLHNSLLEALQRGLQEQQVALSRKAEDQLVQFITLLNKWNTIHNLTAVRDPFAMINHHILDSLGLLNYLPESGAVLDVGTGPGLPGIPLAVARPDLTFVLLDSHHKKSAFVQQVIISLNLSNVTAVCSRVEDLPSDNQFEVVVSRALGTLELFVTLAQPFCKPKGKLIAMKGTLTPQELSALPKPYAIEKIEKVTIPGVNDRSLVFIQMKEEGAPNVN
jgi:16S rRNA (guanine527-N7)-methyltransferase